ncbi:MAG: hypothetical protein M3Q77_00130, partial [Thermoproteota archaeon]|nr:hypothetical protein [Thermoproteota archaeon]
MELVNGYGIYSSNIIVFKLYFAHTGSVHLTKSYRLKMLYLLYDYQKQNTFKVRILWSVFVLSGLSL